jgi:predicted nucleic acid-binding protein
MQQGLAELTPALALGAARLSLDLTLPMADSVMLATARAFDATLWTQDAVFERIQGVRYVARRVR